MSNGFPTHGGQCTDTVRKPGWRTQDKNQEGDSILTEAPNQPEGLSNLHQNDAVFLELSQPLDSRSLSDPNLVKRLVKQYAIVDPVDRKAYLGVKLVEEPFEEQCEHDNNQYELFGPVYYQLIAIDDPKSQVFEIANPTFARSQDVFDVCTTLHRENCAKIQAVHRISNQSTVSRSTTTQRVEYRGRGANQPAKSTYPLSERFVDYVINLDE